MKKSTVLTCRRVLNQERDALEARIKMYRHLHGDKFQIKGMETELKEVKSSLKDLEGTIPQSAEPTAPFAQGSQRTKRGEE